MQFLSDFVGQVIRSALRLVLILAAAVFALSLLVAVLVAVLLTALWSLLTGRKPAMFTTFARFRQASRQFGQSPWSPRDWAAGHGETPGDVVDVQVHEVDESAVRGHLPLDPGARH